MKLVAWVVMVALAAEAACACKGSSSGHATGPGAGTGGSAGSGSGGALIAVDPATCDGQTDHVRSLYQAAATHTDMTPEEVDDNVGMVMKECQGEPARVVPCLAKATAVAQLESTCLAPLDDDGREGKVFLGR
ncbi:MAG TPA: hypothetical protein VHE35_03430 [Kofleriaceae bacterium]|nr:hypothetical protein [Kofleriaceae bacterium]